MNANEAKLFFAHIFFDVVDDDKRPVLLIIVVNIMIIMLNAVLSHPDWSSRILLCLR